MSGIINSAGSKSGVIGRKEMSVIRWRLNASPGTNNQATFGDTSDWIVSESLEFAVGYFGSPTLVTEASGIFSFTETGYYQIASHVNAEQTAGDARWVKCIHSLSNNGTAGTFSAVTEGFTNQLDNHKSHIDQSSLVKVTNLSNDKFKMEVTCENENITHWMYTGTGGLNVTYIDFIKLGGL